jgi:hypothetical protein
MRPEAADIRSALVHAVRQDELVLGSDLYIVSGFELTISHVVFLHPHEGRVRVCLAKAVPGPQKRLVLLVF